VVTSAVGVVALVGATLGVLAVPAGAVDAGDETSFRDAWGTDAPVTIVLTADITLASPACIGGAARTSASPVTIEGNGFSIRQACDSSVLVSSGAGAVTIRNTTILDGSTGVESNGPLRLESSVVDGQSSNGGVAYGVWSNQDVTIVGTTVSAISGGSRAQAVAGFGPGPVILIDSTVRDVTAELVYGVYAESAAISVTRSLITNLTASAGSAFGADSAGGTVDVIDSVISSLTASGEGAQVYGILSAAGAALHGSQVVDLSATDFASAVYEDEESVTVFDSLVADVVSTNATVYAVASEEGDVWFERSTLTRAAAPDGALGVFADDTATLRNSTVTGVVGPAVFADAAVLAYSDIVGNGSDVDFDIFPAAQAGVEALDDGPVLPAAVLDGQVVANTIELFGTVLALPQSGATNCFDGDVVVTSLGYNFADDVSCFLTATGDRQGAGLDPRLGPLADNGGPTPTFLPQVGSPLLDAIPAAACQTPPAAGITTDQRGEPRPAFDACDIGSVEVQPVPVIQPTFTG